MKKSLNISIIYDGRRHLAALFRTRTGIIYCCILYRSWVRSCRGRRTILGGVLSL